MTQLWQFNGGIRLDGHKMLTCNMSIVPAQLPSILILPLLQHKGIPAEPIVQVGDNVLKGQPLARVPTTVDNSVMSVPIHAPSSGKISAIEPRAIPYPIPQPMGQPPRYVQSLCIVIETDGKETWIEKTQLADYTQLSPRLVREQIANAGIVGLGGAGFPSHLKLNTEGIETLIINGAECEPYITCDDRLMQEYPQEIVAGVKILLHCLGTVKRCIITLEDNKIAAYQALLAAVGEPVESMDGLEQPIEIIQIPTLYPTGGERQLIRVLTGKEIGHHQIPAQLGIVVFNVETTRAIYRAIQQGQPLISRVVTVTGSGVAKPQNLEVLLGTPMHVLLNQCERKPELEQLIMGGSMMGFALPDDDMPIIKTTNCLIALSREESQPLAVVMPCIRCNACAEVCAINLLPQQLYAYTKTNNLNKLLEYHLLDCIECGCCAYVCPSHIPLVDYYRAAKIDVIAQEQARQAAELARLRFAAHTERLEQEKTAQALRHQNSKTVDKKAAIAAALERTQAKKN